MDLTTQQRLDLRRLCENATLVEAIAAVCEQEAEQWSARLQDAVMQGTRTGSRNHENEGYCAAQVDAWRNLVGKLRFVAKQPVQP